MRSLLIACVVVCVALMAGVADAAQISDGTLAQMGLSSMQPMSDAPQGAEVRGMGFAWVGGSSSAAVFGANSSNAYGASSMAPWASAAGGSNSAASRNVTVTYGWMSSSITVTVGAGGGAWAMAK